MDNPIIAFLSARRSVKPDRLVAPGPSAEELETILTIASRVPDHKKLAPWRFIVLEGDARARLGEVLAEACVAAEKEPPSHVRLETERTRLMRAPLVIAVVSRVTVHRSAPGMGAGSLGRARHASICASPPTRSATARRGSPSGSRTTRRWVLR